MIINVSHTAHGVVIYLLSYYSISLIRAEICLNLKSLSLCLGFPVN